MFRAEERWKSEGWGVTGWTRSLGLRGQEGGPVGAAVGRGAGGESKEWKGEKCVLGSLEHLLN